MPQGHDTDLLAIRCADCARSDSLDHDLRPTAYLPLPAEALAGYPDGVESVRRFSRRSFMRGGIGALAAVYGATQVRLPHMWDAAVANAAQPMQRSLVVLFLNGGNDGLNVIVPNDATQFAAYNTLRGPLARIQGPSSGTSVGTTVMPGTGSSLAFANKLVAGAANNGGTIGFDTMYGDGSGAAGSDLAVFPAADYTPPNLSHFSSRDFWFAGALQKMSTGWLGRWLDLYGSGVNPLQAVSLGSGLSKQIRSAKAPVCSVDQLGTTSFSIPGVGTSDVDLSYELGRLSGVPAAPDNAGLGKARGAYGTTVQVAQQLKGITLGSTAAAYPNSILSTRLRTAATLLSAGLGTRIITIDWGSFDTHGNQVASQDPQLQTLSRAMAAFKDDLTARGIEQNVVTLVFSEFGRRAKANASNGTDHGAGGTIFVSGTAVRGGLAAIHPGVTSLDSNGDLKVQTDFRTVYEALIAEWLGGDPTAVIPGAPHGGIQRYDAGARLMK
jgi:uncharacterized protein (DUF1501 family)